MKFLGCLKPNGKVFITSSNNNSVMYYHRKVQEKRKAWKYGYQKNWTPNELKEFEVLESRTILGIGDFYFFNLIYKIL